MPEPSPTLDEDRLAGDLDGLRLLGLLDELASDELGGRFTLHEDIRRAAETIVARYREAGVEPGTPEGYLLDFEVRVGVEPGATLALTIDGRGVEAGSLVPLAEGSAGEVEGPLLWVGYGVVKEGEDAAFDELAGLPLAGAVAVVLDGAPPNASAEEGRARPRFDLGDRRLGTKLERLERAGAAAVIVVEARGLSRGEASRAPAEASPDRPVRHAVAIPVVRLDAAEARARLPELLRLRQRIDETARPQSRALGIRARLHAEVTPRIVRAPNILAMVPGGPLADEIVLVGAHYDHIGTDAPGHGHCRATTPAAGEVDRVCNGADDNASGSAIVAELAMSMREAPEPPRRTVVFAHFAGEELGLLGSRDLAARLSTQAPFAGRRVVAMLNVDMVGRLRERLTVSGVGSSSAWMELLDAIGPRDLRVLYDRSLTSRSDHAPFYEQGIPALFFFTELHDDYHAPGDESPAIVREGVLSVAELVAAITHELAAGHPVPFTAPRRPEDGLVRALPGELPSAVIKEVGPAAEVAAP
ncbi:MAG: M28 family peptidase [Myxococcales bacterium]|nr:M28 family peptidase [Myxococcales bacterium]MCB9718203.1 M28 family peptidase [Myxococcales bacterium]